MAMPGWAMRNAMVMTMLLSTVTASAGDMLQMYGPAK
jgi:hypothetical protein